MIGTNSDARIFRLEGLVRQLQQQIAALQTQVGTAQQNLWQPSTPTTGGSSGEGAYKFVSAAGTAAGGSSTETIDKFIGGTWSSIGNATVYNPMPADAITTGHTCPCVPDGNGNFVAISQSCS